MILVNKASRKHSSYSGEINLEDFNTSSPSPNRVGNQTNASDLQALLKDQNGQKKKVNRYNNLTLEDLREMKIISNTDGRPPYNLTDEKWQKEFNVRKYFISPLPSTIKKMGGKYSKETGCWNEETMGTYYGPTNYQEYCGRINDLLSVIKSGQIDYCYFIYQITDLLKFHYNDLRTKYYDGYWSVWLETEADV